MTIRTVAAGARRSGARWSALLSPAGVAVAAVAAVSVVAVVDPNESGHYPTCPFFALTGHFCPGCGSLRAVHALAHGDVAGAIGLNALLVASLPLLGWLWLRWVRRSWTGAPRPALAPPVFLWGGLVLVLAFAVLRNLPMGAALAP
jgi:Zn-dependent protease